MDGRQEAGAVIRERKNEVPGLAQASPRLPPSLLPDTAGLRHLEVQVAPCTSASGQEGV